MCFNCPKVLIAMQRRACSSCKTPTLCCALGEKALSAGSLKKYSAGKRDFVKWSDGCKKTLRTGGTLPRADGTFPFEWARWNFGTVLCEPQSLTGKAKDALNAWLEVRQRSFAFACNLMEGKVPISQAKLGAKHSDVQSTQLTCRATFQMIRSCVTASYNSSAFKLKLHHMHKCFVQVFYKSCSPASRSMPVLSQPRSRSGLFSTACHDAAANEDPQMVHKLELPDCACFNQGRALMVLEQS